MSSVSKSKLIAGWEEAGFAVEIFEFELAVEGAERDGVGWRREVERLFGPDLCFFAREERGGDDFGIDQKIVA